MLEGKVYKSTGSWYLVKSKNKFFECRIKGKIRLKDISTTNPISVGDDVIFEIEDQNTCLLYTSPSPRDKRQSRMPSSA